jgi:hypothetical protein
LSRRRLGGAFSSRAAGAGFCRLVSAAGFRQLKYAAAEALVALRSRNSGASLAAMLEATSLAVQPDLRARSAPGATLFIIFAASAMRSFAPLRATSPPRHILFIMPGITRIGKILRRWCHVWRSFCELTKGHSMISLDEAMLYAPVEWHDCSEGYTDIRYHKSTDGIAKITINRPQVRNAFRPLTVKEMIQALADAAMTTTSA